MPEVWLLLRSKAAHLLLGPVVVVPVKRNRAKPTPTKQAHNLLQRIHRKQDESGRQYVEVEEDKLGEILQEAEGARSLLMELIRRSAHDWVLYKGHSRLDKKQLADDAYTWLFVEDENHPHWQIRKREGKELTSFLCVCEQLNLDPDRIRNYIRSLTTNRILNTGRTPDVSTKGGGSEDPSTVIVHANISYGEGTILDEFVKGFLWQDNTPYSSSSKRPRH